MKIKDSKKLERILFIYFVINKLDRDLIEL